jgi:hypothetical protein
MITVCLIAGGFFVIMMSFSLYMVWRESYYHGQLEERDKHQIAALNLEGEYNEIAARPPVGARAILERMRKESGDNNSA